MTDVMLRWLSVGVLMLSLGCDAASRNASSRRSLRDAILDEVAANERMLAVECGPPTQGGPPTFSALVTDLRARQERGAGGFALGGPAQAFRAYREAGDRVAAAKLAFCQDVADAAVDLIEPLLDTFVQTERGDRSKPSAMESFCSPEQMRLFSDTYESALNAERALASAVQKDVPEFARVFNAYRLQGSAAVPSLVCRFLGHPVARETTTLPKIR